MSKIYNLHKHLIQLELGNIIFWNIIFWNTTGTIKMAWLMFYKREQQHEKKTKVSVIELYK